MITLSEAFRLLQIRNSEIVWLRPVGGGRFSAKPYTEKEIREKFNMKSVQVHHIAIRFSYDEAQDWELECARLEELQKGGADV